MKTLGRLDGFLGGHMAPLIFVDGVMTLMALDSWYSRMAGIAQDSPVSQFFATYFDDDFMANRFQTMTLDPSTAGRM